MNKVAKADRIKGIRIFVLPLFRKSLTPKKTVGKRKIWAMLVLIDMPTYQNEGKSVKARELTTSRGFLPDG
jgi:hypothetical protein